uniref:Oxidored_FMN domain-containing protein n=1 Tax=Heligmosomoides polygyrus TaxID=6339 RepID=A0A183F3V5_HELPZ
LRDMSAKMAKAMKQDGALAVAQLSHGGRQTPASVNPNPYSCSNIELKTRRFGVFGKPVALTEQQVKTEVVDRFVFAAKLAREHG